MKCPHCNSDKKQVKAGRTSFGTQRYKCQICKHKYAPEAKRHGYPVEFKMKAVKLRLEGFSFREIGRSLNTHYQNVINWFNTYSLQLSKTDYKKQK